MDIEFRGKIWFWRCPTPWYFVTVPTEQSRDLKMISNFVTYGWGMIPATVWICQTEWTTSMFYKDEHYIVPIKAWVREAEQIDEGDAVMVRIKVH